MTIYVFFWEVCLGEFPLFDCGGRMYVMSYVIHPVKLRSTISWGSYVYFKS